MRERLEGVFWTAPKCDLGDWLFLTGCCPSRTAEIGQKQPPEIAVFRPIAVVAGTGFNV